MNEEHTKKMMSEEYSRDLMGCLTGIVIAALITIGVGVIAVLLSIKAY